MDRRSLIILAALCLGSSAPAHADADPEFLFAHGLGDPRGAKYGSAIVDGFAVARHGWLVGGRLLGWDGVLYPIAASGPPADVEVDFRTLTAPPAPPSGRIVRYVPRSAVTRRREAEERAKRYLGDAAILEPHRGADSPALTAALLARAGRTDLAEKARAAWGVLEADDTFLNLATGWMNVHYLRAIAAHCAGNDAQVALWTTAVLGALPAFREEAARRRYPRAWNSQTNKMDLPYFSAGAVWYGDIPTALVRLDADSKRRLKSPKKLLSLPELSQISNQQRRIQALIDALEEDTLSSYGFSDGELSRRLIDEGIPAVEPLLACAGSDTRLTRGSTPTSHGSPLERQPIPVAKLAFDLAARILHVP